MKQEQARAALYAATASAISNLTPTPAVQWDNRNLVDMGSQVDPYLAVDFVVSGGSQKSLGKTKVVRYLGMLVICAAAREGQGVKLLLQWLDALTSPLQMRDIGGVVTQAAMPQAPKDVLGWHIRPLALPFWYDDIVESP